MLARYWPWSASKSNLHHFPEFGRQTNTGKILTTCCPHSQMYVSGLPDQVEAMFARLRANPTTSLILFPSPDSITVEQFLSRFAPKKASTAPATEKGKDKEAEGAEKGPGALRVTDFPPLNIVVIDGTWNQAKHLVYTIPPEVPRVRISPTGPSLFLLRKVKVPSCSSQEMASNSLSKTAITIQSDMHA